MHVRIAWEIYNHQQKEKTGGGGVSVSSAEKDKMRAFPAPAPPPPTYRSPYDLPPGPYLPHHAPLDKECVRSYTPVGDNWDHYGSDLSALKLAVKRYDKGILSPHLANLKVGEMVTLSGPYGNFQLQKRQMAVERREAPAQDAQEAPQPADVEPATEVLVLTLNHGEHQDATLYKFEKGCRLQFSPGPSLLGRKVFLYTNYVVSEISEEKGDPAEFARNLYYRLEWRRDEPAGKHDEPLGCGLLVTDEDAHCELHLARAGVYHYYWVYDSPEARVGPQGSGWFHVAPSLRAGGHLVPLHAVMCQIVLAKCLGPLPRWSRTLRVAHEAGYNTALSHTKRGESFLAKCG